MATSTSISAGLASAKGNNKHVPVNQHIATLQTSCVDVVVGLGEKLDHVLVVDVVRAEVLVFDTLKQSMFL